MKIPIIYNLRSLRQRPVSTLTTALGMALVVAVFVSMMALSNGFQSALTSTGSDENVFLLRKGAGAELNSGIARDAANVVAGMPFIAKGTDGRPLVSAETFVVIPLQRVGGGGMANVVVRGVSLAAFDVRRGLEILEGRKFRPGSREIVVGRTFARRFPNSEIGGRINFGGQDWTVVGHFAAAGSSFESEIWGEAEQFMPVFRGQVFSAITFRMSDPANFAGIKETLEADPRLYVDAYQEKEFYDNQGTLLNQILNFLAVFIAGIMAIGAVFGAVNTMYAAVASRVHEIGVLLSLGFKPRNVMSSFLFEALLIALLGGAVGCLLVLPVDGLVTSTTNWNSFSELAFSFSITPRLILYGMVFAATMGLIGGYLPARRAAKARVADALRR
ncbi:MAG: ABC transporter permease [Gemmatimonadota bacterium]|nr:ABC transporter permease [Gemmatimonadota bacterium]